MPNVHVTVREPVELSFLRFAVRLQHRQIRQVSELCNGVQIVLADIGQCVLEQALLAAFDKELGEFARGAGRVNQVLGLLDGDRAWFTD